MEDTHLKTFTSDGTTGRVVISNAGPAQLSSVKRDEAQLARFGKRQQLQRNFKFVSTVALTCTIMITWEGFLTTFEDGLLNGGPAGVVYGFIFVWIGNILQVLVMAEMGSMVPIAGGQYNWVAVLAPKSCRKFLSYLTGWSTFISWQAALASGCYLAGTMIQGLLVLNYPDYGYQRWHGTLIIYAILVVALIVNTYLAILLPQIESFVLFIHFFGFFGVLVPLIYFAPHSTPSEVFDQFLNGGGWQTDGLSFFVGLVGAMYAFIGTDTSAHMAEEIEGASSIIPWSMISAVLINGTLGFSMMIAILFCLGDPEAVLSSSTQYPYIQIFANAVGSNAGGTAMVSVVTAMMIFAAIGSLATASRMTWAFARERGLPGHGYLSRVNERTHLPLYSIGLCVVISAVLGLINIGSSAAFNAFISLLVAGSYSCFALAASVMLHKRLTLPEKDIPWGQFRLGRAGVPVTVAALIYTVIGFFFSFWPAAPAPTPTAMNWSSLVYGASILFSMAYWAVWGRKVYTGPILEVVLEGDQTLFQSI